MNNFLKQINILLAALKSEDIEKFTEIQLSAETIFKVKSRYDHLFGKDDRYYIDVDNIKIEDYSYLLEQKYKENFFNINEELKWHGYKIKNAEMYLKGKANKLDKETRTFKEPKDDPKNLESIDKILTSVINKEIERDYLPQLKIVKEYIFNEDIIKILNDESLNDSKKIVSLHKIFRNTRLKEIFEEDFFNTHRDDDIDQFVNILIDTSSLINMKSIYSSRPSLKSLQNDRNLMIVVSRKAEDIAGMSTDRRWKSCMELPGYDKNKMFGGSFHSRLFYDIKLGTLVAYLIRKDDKEIEDPLARIAIKPMFSTDDAISYSIIKILEKEDFKDINSLSDEEKSLVEKFKNTEFVFYLRPEKQVYSDGSLPANVLNKFKEEVIKFCHSHNKNTEGAFELSELLYNDTGNSIEYIVKDEKIKEKFKKLAKNFNNKYLDENDAFEILLSWYFSFGKDINNWLFKAIENKKIDVSIIMVNGKLITIEANNMKDITIKNENFYGNNLNITLENYCDNCNFENISRIVVKNAFNSSFDNCTLSGGNYRNCHITNCEFMRNIYVYSNKFKDYVVCAVNTEQFENIEKYMSSLEDFRNTIKRKF